MAINERMSIPVLLAGILAATFASIVFGQVPSPQTSVEGPPARFEPCKKTYGPWPPHIPAGSKGFNDGQHANMSYFLVSTAHKSIKGIKTVWVDFLLKDQTIPSFTTFKHGTVTGLAKAIFNFSEPNVTPFVQVQGIYTDAGGLDALGFVDTHGNTYEWGNWDPFTPIPPPPRKFFSSPANVGRIVGLFGANTKGALTQIGVCVSG